MLYHDLKLGLRNAAKNKTFSFINVLGLSMGLACCIVIGLYAYTEASFDKFHTGHGAIYRINKITNEKGKQPQRDGLTPGKLAPAAVGEIPEIIAATRFRPWFDAMLVSYDTVRTKLSDIAFADASFLQMFDFSMLEGDRKSALSEPFTAVITQTTAKRYFGNANPVGKTLKTLNGMPARITGVLKDLPFASSLRFNLLLSWATLLAPANAGNFSWMNSWSAQVGFTFVQLKPGADATKVNGKIAALMHRNFAETEFQYRTYLQSLDDIHLGSAGVVYAEPFKTNSDKMIYTLLITAGIILVIACFNFINLTTAGALSRARETGVQKVLGASQPQLIRKFFSETFLMCLVSFLLSLALVSVSLPFFNRLAGAQLNFSLLFEPKLAAALLGLLLLVSVAAGIYPALFLARFGSADIFRNTVKAGKDRWLRQSLVTVQFSLSVILIIATAVVNNQIHYLGTKDLGFNKEQIVVLPLSGTAVENKSKDFVAAIKQSPNIAAASVSANVPGQGLNGFGIIPEGHTLNEHLLANEIETDADFASVYNIQPVQGRYFSSQMPTDTSDAIVINEAMATMLGWKNAVGKRLEIYEARKGKVIGVIRDFNFASLREKVQPLAVILANNPRYLSIKLKAGSVQSSLGFLGATWKRFDSEYPFDYFFLDEALNHYYQSDTQLLHALNVFAVLSVFIACIGLLGLSIYSAKQRIKEVGIRKVLGASVAQIVLLLSSDFLRLVIVAIIIASPVAWFAANKWLQEYAYHIDVQWWVFAAAGAAACIVALLTVGYQAIKAALVNPVKSLRTE